jgi:hypothetical protein
MTVLIIVVINQRDRNFDTGLHFRERESGSVCVSHAIHMTPYILFFSQNLETFFATDKSFFVVDKWEITTFPMMDR